MALISAKTILTSISLFHITLGFFFITNPGIIADQALVYILGDAMGMPHDRSFESRSPTLAFLAVVLATMGVSDIVTFSMREEVCLIEYWGTQAPLRLLISLLLFAYTFLFSSSSPLYRSDPLRPLSTRAPPSPGYRTSGWGGDALRNRVFFTFVFLEMVAWFWVWVTLREERREIVARSERRRARQRGYVE